MYAINFKPRLADVVNPCRVFGLEEESGTVVCDWPPGALRPVIPVPYSQETFHGLEYAFGAMLMREGEIARGVRVFRAVRDRYRGDNRNPWNEMECGSNYVRSMASYAGLLALSGFGFDLTIERVAFAPRVQSSGRFQSFWAVGSAWGEATFEDGAFDLRVLGGEIRLARIGLPLTADAARGSTVTVNGRTVESTVDAEAVDTVFAAVRLARRRSHRCSQPALERETSARPERGMTMPDCCSLLPGRADSPGGRRCSASRHRRHPQDLPAHQPVDRGGHRGCDQALQRRLSEGEGRDAVAAARLVGRIHQRLPQPSSRRQSARHLRGRHRGLLHGGEQRAVRAARRSHRPRPGRQEAAGGHRSQSARRHVVRHRRQALLLPHVVEQRGHVLQQGPVRSRRFAPTPARTGPGTTF